MFTKYRIRTDGERYQVEIRKWPSWILLGWEEGGSPSPFNEWSIGTPWLMTEEEADVAVKDAFGETAERIREWRTV
jgi:hypothetical protein